MTLIVGIDPGVNGGIAFLRGDEHLTFKMPLWKEGILEGEVSSLGIFNLIQDARVGQEDIVIGFEAQGIFGKGEKQTPTTVFGMGGGYKSVRLAVQMAADTLDAKILDPIYSISWKSKLGLRAPTGSTGKQKKEITRLFLEREFESPDVYGKKGGYKDGRGDALAIAYYIREYKI
jgi:hypothetical protein